MCPTRRPRGPNLIAVSQLCDTDEHRSYELLPDVAASASSATLLALTTGRASASAYAGMPLTIKPNTAAELHAHEWPISTPLDAFTGTFLAAGVTYASRRLHGHVSRGGRDLRCSARAIHVSSLT
jgi:hypothetical protein